MHEDESSVRVIVRPGPRKLGYTVVEMELFTVHAIRASRVRGGWKSDSESNNSPRGGEAQLECRFERRQESPARHGRAVAGSSKFVHPDFL